MKIFIGAIPGDKKISRRFAGLRGEKSMKKSIKQITVLLFDVFILMIFCE